MFVLNRSLTRRTGRAIAPSGRPVQAIPGFDTSLPAVFPVPDTTAVVADILGQLRMLTTSNAVDGAHAAILDPLTAAAMAPFFHAATEHFSTSLRVIQQLDQQAIEVATTAYERGLKAAEEAEQAEKEADATYLVHVGIERIRSIYREATDWEVLKEKLRQHHLALDADTDTLAFVDRGFRGDDHASGNVSADKSAPGGSKDTPAGGSEGTPAGSSESRPPQKPIDTNNHPSRTH